MGRHSDPDPRWFWLSLGAAAGKALLGVLVLVAVVAGVTRLAGSGSDGQEPVVRTAPAVTEPAATEATSPPGTTPGPSPTTPPPDEDEDEDGGDEEAVRATVQVLNGSGDASALQEVIAALEELGYQVVAQSRAARAYTRTTVFWSEGFQDEAEELRDRDDRFGVLEENDRLDATINLHVVIGRDWLTSR